MSDKGERKMKSKIYLSAVTAILLLASISLSAQEEAKHDDVSTVLEKIFGLCKIKNYKDASIYFAYTGDSAERKYKSSLKADVSGELKQSERLGKKIKAYLEISDSYQFKKSAESVRENINWVDVTVHFKSGQQTLSIPFKFVKAGDKLLLAEID